MKPKPKSAPIHPGTVLLTVLQAAHPPMSQAEAAARLQLPRSCLNQVVVGHRPVTPDLALRLADLTGRSAPFWVTLQGRYDLWHAAVARAKQHAAPIQPLVGTPRTVRRGPGRPRHEI